MKHQPPGRLSPRIDPEVIMMLCTAGHVDHGKTALVGLLTGCQTDRLKVEQERGLTIELGFAPCFLGGNRAVGIVDVPGHEKFIKNMVAGVSGIGMTLLVIAADDGVMPQTTEHLQIMELLGISHGMVALTKTDLVTPEQVQRRAEEIKQFLTGTKLEGSPICPVSSETFEGYPEFYATLLERIDTAVSRRVGGVFRMPIERVFTQEGFGCVMTGIPTTGTISVGDQLELVQADGGRVGKIRGIQRFLRDADSGGAGQCLALNIPDFSKNPPTRGDLLCAPGHLRTANIFHLDIHAIPKLDKPLENAESIKFHSGTIEESGKIYLLEDKTLLEGQKGLASVVLANPVAVAVHDRFIVRRASPAITVGGGDVLAVTHGERRPRKPEILKQLRAYKALFDLIDIHSCEGDKRKLAHCLRWEHTAGAGAVALARSALIETPVARERLDDLVKNGEAIALSEDFFIHRDVYAVYLGEVEARIRQASERQALSLSTSDLRGKSKHPPALWNRLLADILDKSLVRRRGDLFIVPGAVAKMPQADRELMERILDIYQRTGFKSPRPDQLPAMTGAPRPQIDKLLRHLYNEAELIRLDKNVTLHYDTFKKAQDLVVRTIQQTGTIDSADFKAKIQTSRKYAIALLDYLDAQRITVRVNNDRKLTRDYERYLL